MGPSKPPKDVLELGRYLVRELGFEDGVDTLGRWMAHHLAELIDKSETSSTESERLRARKTATETIVKIWEHRRSLPGKAYPLAQYKNALMILDRLHPDSNPFWYFTRPTDTERDRLAAELFDGLTRLIIALLYVKIPYGEITEEANSAATEALSETEQHVLKAIQHWRELFKPPSKGRGKVKESEGGEGDTEINIDEITLQLIDRTMTTLVELRSVIDESD